MDLRDEFAEMPCRRLWALVNGLPLDAATWRRESAWTVDHELMATMIETIDMWGRINAIVGGAKWRKLPDQIRVPRPWDDGIAEETAADEEEGARQVAKFFGGIG